jgi:hypothetical protein
VFEVASAESEPSDKIAVSDFVASDFVASDFVASDFAASARMEKSAVSGAETLATSASVEPKTFASGKIAVGPLNFAYFATL